MSWLWSPSVGKLRKSQVFLQASLGLLFASRTAACLRRNASEAALVPALHLTYSIPETVPSGGIKTLPLTIVLPRSAVGPLDEAQSAADGAGCPVIFFFNGFKLRASFYSPYVQQLASAGYAVVQYDVPLLKTPNDALEVGFLPGLVHWLEAQNQSTASPLRGRLDLTRIGAAGHSRGGKLAALHLTGEIRIAAAYLIDPVDNTSATPESTAYPSACAALRRAGKPVAITGAGVIGPCNPAGSNYKVFFEAVANTSWLMDVKGAGHATFFEAPWPLSKAFDLLCRKGTESHEEAIQLASRPMLAWFNRHLQPAVFQEDKDNFFQWVHTEEQLGKITFQVKGGTPEQQQGLEADQAQGRSNIVPFSRSRCASDSQHHAGGGKNQSQQDEHAPVEN